MKQKKRFKKNKQTNKQTNGNTQNMTDTLTKTANQLPWTFIHNESEHFWENTRRN